MKVLLLNATHASSLRLQSQRQSTCLYSTLLLLTELTMYNTYTGCNELMKVDGTKTKKTHFKLFQQLKQNRQIFFHSSKQQARH